VGAPEECVEEMRAFLHYDEVKDKRHFVDFKEKLEETLQEVIPDPAAEEHLATGWLANPLLPGGWRLKVTRDGVTPANQGVFRKIFMAPSGLTLTGQKAREYAVSKGFSREDVHRLDTLVAREPRQLALEIHEGKEAKGELVAEITEGAAKDVTEVVKNSEARVAKRGRPRKETAKELARMHQDRSGLIRPTKVLDSLKKTKKVPILKHEKPVEMENKSQKKRVKEESDVTAEGEAPAKKIRGPKKGAKYKTRKQMAKTLDNSDFSLEELAGDKSTQQTNIDIEEIKKIQTSSEVRAHGKKQRERRGPPVWRDQQEQNQSEILARILAQLPSQPDHLAKILETVERCTSPVPLAEPVKEEKEQKEVKEDLSEKTPQLYNGTILQEKKGRGRPKLTPEQKHERSRVGAMVWREVQDKRRGEVQETRKKEVKERMEMEERMKIELQYLKTLKTIKCKVQAPQQSNVEFKIEVLPEKGAEEKSLELEAEFLKHIKVDPRFGPSHYVKPSAKKNENRELEAEFLKHLKVDQRLGPGMVIKPLTKKTDEDAEEVESEGLLVIDEFRENSLFMV